MRLHEAIKALNVLIDKALRLVGVEGTLGKDVASLFELLLHVFPHWLRVLKQEVLGLDFLNWDGIKLHDLTCSCIVFLEARRRGGISGSFSGDLVTNLTDDFLQFVGETREE